LYAVSEHGSGEAMGREVTADQWLDQFRSGARRAMLAGVRLVGRWLALAFFAIATALVEWLDRRAASALRAARGEPRRIRPRGQDAA
jgi:hypothetical protein